MNKELLKEQMDMYRLFGVIDRWEDRKKKLLALMDGFLEGYKEGKKCNLKLSQI